MVSVVIPTYGRPDKVKEAVVGALKQTYSDYEIVVVDDNGLGTDNQINTQITIESIKSDRIRYIIHEENRGGCAARNTGIKNSVGEYIAFLDDDDLWSVDYLKIMLECFSQDNIGAVYCDLYTYNGVYTCASRGKKHPCGDIRNELLMGWCPVSTSLVMVRRSAIVDCGLFDEKVKSFQDYDMWMSLASKKYEFAYCDRKLLLKFEGIGDQTSVNPYKRQAGFEYICEKWEPTLDDDERKLFMSFKAMYQDTIRFNRVVYHKRNGEKYWNELIGYLRSDAPIAQKIKLIKRIYLPSGISTQLTFILAKRDKGMELIKGRIKAF